MKEGLVHLYACDVFNDGADEGWLQRAVRVNDQLHIIEELQLFEEPQPVDSIVISEKQVRRSWNK